MAASTRRLSAASRSRDLIAVVFKRIGMEGMENAADGKFAIGLPD